VLAVAVAALGLFGVTLLFWLASRLLTNDRESTGLAEQLIIQAQDEQRDNEPQAVPCPSPI
jgi:hypothetical protein